MCGINGIFSFNGTGFFDEQVRKMNACLAHRGPDDEGLFSAEGIALGHRRLSIIDLSPAGHQPMQYAEGRFTIVYNGELYNYRELKQELADFSFSTSSDTEVILAAYAKWGTACLDRLNGMFAFAVYDKAERTVFIARDRLGIKPLYYTQVTQNDSVLLAFSSELRPLLASGMAKPVLNKEGLADYLFYQTVHAPGTIVDGVQMLLPGHYMKLGTGCEIEKWWEAGGNVSDEISYNDACKNVRRLLTEAVERRLVADVPFGAFLSGGIDSSAVVALMKEVSAAKIKTFSVVFDKSELSEAVYARMIAKKFGTDHHELLLSPDDFLHDLPAALDAMDHPSGDGPNTYVVSKATKAAGITMALSGLGGDELFAGYDIFRRAVSLEKKSWLNAFPRSLRSAGGSILRSVRPGVASEKMAMVLGLSHIDFESFYPFSRQVLLDEQIRTITGGKFTHAKSVRQAAAGAARRAGGKTQLLSRVSIAEIETYMQNVLLRDTDQMSMANALEVRVPFLDYQLVEYVLGLPDALKFPHRPKQLLVDAMGDLLPREIVERPKMGFILPWKHWMKKELRAFCEERLNLLGAFPGFDPAGITRLWNAFLQDDPRVTYSRIWPLVVLGHWFKKQGIHG